MAHGGFGMNLRTGNAMVAIRALCVLALLLLSFAHKPIDAVTPELSAVEIAQYVLPDGKVPAFCLTGNNSDGKSQQHGHVPDCSACRISASFDMPHQQDAIGERRMVADAILRIHTIALRHYHAYSPNFGPRGPPISITI
jgi:hypothetical protein